MLSKAAIAATLISALVRAAPVVANAGPSGTYQGSKSVFFVSADFTITIKTPTSADLSISVASKHISCPGEPFALGPEDPATGTSQVTLTNLGKADDCVSTQLKNLPFPARVVSIAYNWKTDKIAVDVSIKAFGSEHSIDATLDHQTSLSTADTFVATPSVATTRMAP